MLDVTNEAFEAAWANDNNRRVILKVCRRFKNQLSKEELSYRGFMALIYCLHKHNPNSNNKFTNSLYRHTYWQCYKALREEDKYLRNSVLPEDLEQSDRLFFDRLCVRDCVDSLPTPHQSILKDYYFQGLTLREIGQKNGYTHVAAHRKLEQAKDAFRRLYEAE